MNRRNFFSVLGKTAATVVGVVCLPKQVIKLPVKIYKNWHKGSVFIETGYVYAPYIPFYTTPVVMTKNGIFNI